jgi:hypothetical protein
MIILDPTDISDASMTGANGTYWDANGVLQTAAANALRVTYDPADLSAPPYALIEGEARNLALQSEDLTASWTVSVATVVPNAIAAPDGALTADKLEETAVANQHLFYQIMSAPVVGDVYAVSCFAKAAERTKIAITMHGEGYSVFDLAAGTVSQAGGNVCTIASLKDGWYQCTALITKTNTNGTFHFLLWETAQSYLGVAGHGAYFWGMECKAGKASSYIKTTTAAVTRPADIISTTGTFLASNVPEDDAPAYVPGTYALGAQVIDSHLVYESKANANTAPLTDATKWLLIGATNQRKMLDQYNNTATEHPEEIVLTLTPRQIAQGFYVGEVDGSEVSVVMQDNNDNIVYSHSESMILSNSGSSAFNWCFKRIQRKTYFFTGDLPVYSNPRVTISIKNPGGTAKCGMCAVGPLIDVGLSKYGLSTEIKDFSSSTFAFDGTSSTIQRGYAKVMSVDMMVENSQIDSVQQQLANFRQRPVVWVGAAMYGSAIIYGKYSSFKNVIAYPAHSIMSLNIQGTV